jgi:hypothetical protein
MGRISRVCNPLKKLGFLSDRGPLRSREKGAILRGSNSRTSKLEQSYLVTSINLLL